MSTRARKWTSAAAVGLFAIAISTETFAVHRVVRPVVGVRVAPSFYYGPAVRPPHYRAPRVVEVARVGYGEVDFNVEPQSSRLWVDGRYFGIADDFNGWPQTARLPAGYHDVRVVAPDGRRDERRIFVAAGREMNFNLKF